MHATVKVKSPIFFLNTPPRLRSSVPLGDKTYFDNRVTMKVQPDELIE